jgi:hypothetical protein
MDAARAIGRAVTLPCPPPAVPPEVYVALVTEAEGDNDIVVDALELKPAFHEVAAGLGLGVFGHADAFPFDAAALRSSAAVGAPFM